MEALYAEKIRRGCPVRPGRLHSIGEDEVQEGTAMTAAAETQVWTVWLDQVQKIASFHAVEGYDQCEFRDHSHFLHYMEDLQNSGYLFQ